MKLDVKVILIIVFASSLLGLFYNYLSPSGIPLIAEEKKLKWAQDSLFSSTTEETGSLEITTKDDSIRNFNLSSDENTDKTDEEKKLRTESEKEKSVLSEPAAIHIKQAYSLHQKNVLFIDAREPADYQDSHIKNAINIPFDHFDENKHLLNDIDKGKIIVTYCAGTDCDLSKLLGNILFEMGYKKIYVFFGGWNEWLEANYPVEKGNTKE